MRDNMNLGYTSELSAEVSEYKIVTVSDMWTTKRLMEKAEKMMNEKREEGWRIVSVSISYNILFIPTAFITIAI